MPADTILHEIARLVPINNDDVMKLVVLSQLCFVYVCTYVIVRITILERLAHTLAESLSKYCIPVIVLYWY